MAPRGLSKICRSRSTISQWDPSTARNTLSSQDYALKPLRVIVFIALFDLVSAPAHATMITIPNTEANGIRCAAFQTPGYLTIFEGVSSRYKMDAQKPSLPT